MVLLEINSKIAMKVENEKWNFDERSKVWKQVIYGKKMINILNGR